MWKMEKRMRIMWNENGEMLGEKNVEKEKTMMESATEINVA